MSEMQGEKPEGQGSGSEDKPQTDWQAEARKWEQRAKANKTQLDDLLAKSKQADDAGKTEMQRLTERLDAAEKAAAKASRDALVQRIGAEHKLPQSIVARLQGDTEDEITADAKALAEVVRQRARPAGDVDAGTRGAPASKSPRDIFADLFS